MKFMRPFAGPVEVIVDAYMPIPASYPTKKRGECIAGVYKHTKKPDIDNLLKSALDGINGVVVIDDAQVVKVTATKKYAESPQLIITVIGQE